MANQFTPSYLACRHCAALIGWPRWARVEPGRYTPLCWPCFDRLDQTFTAEAAIAQAIFDVWIHSSAPVRPHYRRQERTLRRVGGR